jgi:hypothetical protein
MDFKLKEHGLIWENYMTRFGSQDEEDDRDDNIMDEGEYDHSDEYGDDDFGDDDFGDEGQQSVVMSFDTSEPVEMDHDDHHEDDHDDYATTERNDMIRSELAKLVEFANRLSEMSKDADFEEWMAAKITKASDYTSDVYFRLSTKADYANCGCDQ